MFSSVQFSCWVVSDSLWPYESLHARPPCPSPAPGVHSDSRPSSQWCHPAISSSVVPFSSCPKSLPASESFPMSQLFTRGGQSTGVSALASFLPKNTQGWSPSEWTGWISLQSKGVSRVFFNTTVQNIESSALSLLHSPTLTSIHDYWKCPDKSIESWKYKLKIYSIHLPYGTSVLILAYLRYAQNTYIRLQLGRIIWHKAYFIIKCWFSPVIYWTLY